MTFEYLLKRLLSRHGDILRKCAEKWSKRATNQKRKALFNWEMFGKT